MSAEQPCATFQCLDEKTLATWPLPMPALDGDKEDRGRALIVAGSREMSGVAVLCATAALRAGAGKVTIATGEATASMVALAMPECRVIGLPESATGGFAEDAVHALDGVMDGHHSVLIGPGLQDEDSVLDLVNALRIKFRGIKLILDAYAMGIVTDPHGRGLPTAGGAAQEDRSAEISESDVLITPHAGELAHLTGETKAFITEKPQRIALSAAQQWGVIVALKGAVTHIATPERRGWRHSGGSVGLSASGSGDTLAGVIVGLAARGATLEQASAWGVVLHGLAGKRLETRFGPLGYMAREIAGEIPALMHELGPREEARNA